MSIFKETFPKFVTDQLEIREEVKKESVKEGIKKKRTRRKKKNR